MAQVTEQGSAIQNARPRISIVVPNYKTEELTRLCLRSLRKYSSLSIEVIVVDNNSADSSLDYLRRVRWVRLIENPSGSTGSLAHREALDLGSSVATGDWLFLIHSDTIVLKPGWDRKLVELAEREGAIGFSTTVRNLDRFDPLFRRLATWLKDKLRGGAKQSSNIKLMSHCFGIKRDAIPLKEFSFQEASDAVTDLFDRHIRGKRKFLLLDRSTLEPILWHPSNVTSIVTKQMQEKGMVTRFERRIRRLKRQKAVAAILKDDSLDQ